MCKGLRILFISQILFFFLKKVTRNLLIINWVVILSQILPLLLGLTKQRPEGVNSRSVQDVQIHNLLRTLFQHCSISSHWCDWPVTMDLHCPGKMNPFDKYKYWLERHLFTGRWFPLSLHNGQFVGPRHSLY